MGPTAEVVIVDYGVGNHASIANMLRRAGATSAIISSEPERILSAEKLVLSGVGPFARGMDSLRARGLVSPLSQRVLIDRRPMLGICLGMQLLSRQSEEGGGPGLGWVPADTARFRFDSGSPFKVPHMGWNSVTFASRSRLGEGLGADARFYFVHSYYVVPDDQDHVVGATDHGGRFASAIESGNIYGVQFHPEKSHRFGLRLMQNFLRL